MTTTAPGSGVSPGEAAVIAGKSVETLMPGLRTWINEKNGFRVIDLEYTADPRKRTDEWRAQAQNGVPTAEWNREYGPSWNVYDGKPVYSDFEPSIHVSRGPIVSPRRSRLISGWDAGPNDLHLGWALGLTAPGELQVQVVDYHYAEDGDIEDFVQVVGSKLRLEWLKFGGFSLHVCDQSVFTKSSVANGRAVADIMRQHGLSPIPGEISFTKRRQSVENLLKFGPRNPRFLVHERCDMIIEGLSGGYSYGRSNVIGGHTFKPTPIKNKFSHVINAVEYLCSRLELTTQEIPYEGQRLPRMSIV